MPPEKSELEPQLYAQYMQALMEAAPVDIDPRVARFLVKNPRVLRRLLGCIREVPLPTESSDLPYAPLITIQSTSLVLVLYTWLQGSTQLPRARDADIIREQSLAVGKRFRPHVFQFNNLQSSAQVRRAAARRECRPGRAFELLSYLVLFPQEPVGAQRLIAMAEHEWSSREPFFAIENRDGNRAARFIADEKKWPATDRFFMVHEEEE